MHPSSFHTLPPFFLALVILFGVVIAILQIGILGYAYEKMGISRLAAFAILLFSLAGSAYNLPIAELPSQQVGEPRVVYDSWGVRYQVVTQMPATVLAINVGGAIIPTLLSIYLVVKNQIYGEALLGIAIAAAVVHALAEPVPQMGITVPIFLPPIVSAVVAMLLSRDYAAPLAYVTGCMGTLLGADLLNLGVLTSLGAPVASIGGAGTFDGVFLTGILAVLLAITPRRHDPRRATAPPRPGYDDSTR